MDAIVTAGGIPLPQDPLYTYAKGDSKALLDVAGKPMIQWVLDALGEARDVENVIIVGLTPKSGLTCSKPLHYLSNQGRMLSNIVAGVNKVLEINPQAEYVLIVSSDIPALRGEHVDWLIETCMQTRDDLYYGVCPREVMETRFPNSRRTYTKLKDMQVCGADINVSHVRMATEHLDMWEQLIGNRKSPMKQAATIGFGTLFMLATGNLTLTDAVERITERIGITGRPIVWEHAEPCMDVDKPHQLEMLREDLQARLEAEAATRAESTPVTESAPKPVRRAKKPITPKAESTKAAAKKAPAKSTKKPATTKKTEDKPARVKSVKKPAPKTPKGKPTPKEKSVAKPKKSAAK
ncbi:MAG: nucleotidyltransferase family protein [Chloroflexi bacterium]|nr:nucleotidyltransferase family protein [Chloroflexota bacterium]